VDVCPSLIVESIGVGKIAIPRHVLESLWRERPGECVSALFGTRIEDLYHVLEAYKLRGTYTQGTFRVDFGDWVEAVRRATSNGLEYIGLLHIHKDSQSTPSPLDLRRMMECPGEVWVILSKSGVRAWVYESELRELVVFVT